MPTPNLGVLVGGQSRRFPGGKLVADFFGKPLLTHVLDSLTDLPGRHFLLGTLPPTIPLPPSWHLLPDQNPGCGPLAGYRTMAEHSPDGFLLVGGDMPFLKSAPLLTLWKASEGSAAACLKAEKRPHPLFVAVRPEAYPKLLGPPYVGKTPGPRQFLREIGARPLPPEELGLTRMQAQRLVFDIDTPENLETAISLAHTSLSEGPP
jgi:molybdopterin-guanine dinucleotide biosynthesis protein A